METISKSKNVLNYIIKNMNDVFNNNPQVVDDVYIKDDGVKIYLKRKNLAVFDTKYAYDFAVIPKKGEITNLITFYFDNLDECKVSITTINPRVVLFELLVNMDEPEFDSLTNIYFELESLYNKDIDIIAKQAVNTVFDI